MIMQSINLILPLFFAFVVIYGKDEATTEVMKVIDVITLLFCAVIFVIQL